MFSPAQSVAASPLRPPVIDRAASIAGATAGQATVGTALTLTGFAYVGTGAALSYQWTRAGANIATSAGYTLVTADAGNNIGCTITVANAAGSVSRSTATILCIAASSGPDYAAADYSASDYATT